MFYVQFFIRKWDFLLTYSFWPPYDPGVTQLVVEVSTGDIP